MKKIIKIQRDKVGHIIVGLFVVIVLLIVFTLVLMNDRNKYEKAFDKSVDLYKQSILVNSELLARVRGEVFDRDNVTTILDQMDIKQQILEVVK